MHKYRTHTCCELNKTNVGQTVKLSGWLHNKRDHGGVLFIDLRDHFGLTQTVIYPEADFQDTLAHTHKETVIMVEGTVQMRSEENINKNIDLSY